VYGAERLASLLEQSLTAVMGVKTLRNQTGRQLNLNYGAGNQNYLAAYLIYVAAEQG